MYISRTPVIIGNAREELDVLAELPPAEYTFSSHNKISPYVFAEITRGAEAKPSRRQRKAAAEAINAVHAKIVSSLIGCRPIFLAVDVSRVRPQSSAFPAASLWHPEYYGMPERGIVIGSNRLDLATRFAVGEVENEEKIADLPQREAYVDSEIISENLREWSPKRPGDLLFVAHDTLHKPRINLSPVAVSRALYHAEFTTINGRPLVPPTGSVPTQFAEHLIAS